MRNRSNGGIIGPKNEVKQYSKSGVWGQNDVIENITQGPVIESEQMSVKANWNYPEGQFDPYYNTVITHFSDIDAPDHMLRDRSVNQHDENYAQVYSYTNLQLANNFGPGYPYWSTTFTDDGYMTVTDTTGIQLASSAFTIEFWAKLARNDATQHYIMGRGNQAGVTAGLGWTVFLDSNYRVGFYDAVGNQTTTSTQYLNRDQWYHIAIVRNNLLPSGTVVYVDGQQVGVGQSSGSFTDSANLYIGRDRVASGTTEYRGLLTDIRITRANIYQGNFSRPTGPLGTDACLFTHSITTRDWDAIQDKQKERLKVTPVNTYRSKTIDTPFTNFSSLSTSTGSSSMFVSGPVKIWNSTTLTTSSLHLGYGPFTVEAWVYFTTQGASRGIIGKGNGNQNISTGTGWSMMVDSSNYLAWHDQNITLTGTGPVIYNCAWYHVAAVRQSTATNGFNLFVNGTIAYTGTLATLYDDNSNVNTPMQLFGTRDAQYTMFGYIAGVKVTKTAQYTGTFTTSIYSTDFMMQAMSTSTATVLLTAVAPGIEARNNFPQYKNFGKAVQLVPYRNSNELRFGHNHPTSRRGFSIISGQVDGRTRVTATSLTSDFNFGIGDFSVEMWINANGAEDAVSTVRTIFDMRTAYNDSGIMIRYGANYSIDVQGAGGRFLLADNRFRITQRQWNHICLQRSNGALGLYINGKKSAETICTATIASPSGTITIGNMNNPVTNIFGYNSWYGWYSDVRINKGIGAYSVNGTNPDVFAVPTAPLTAMTTTVLLTCGGPILRDYSGRNNNVSWPRGAFDGQSGWDCYVTNYGPYSGVGYDRTKEIIGQNHDTSDGWSTLAPHDTDGWRTELSFINRLSKPWTIEGWCYGYQTGVASPTNNWIVYNATTNGHEGFAILAHENAGGASYGNLTFRFYANSTVQYISTSTQTDFKGHSWNHYAVVYDPTSTTKVALFINGRRANTGVLTSGTSCRSTYRFQTGGYGYGNSAGHRISDTVRYPTTATTYTIPTQMYTYDSSTVVAYNVDGPWNDIAMVARHYQYGNLPSTKYKKFGRGSMKFSNKLPEIVNSTQDRIAMGYGVWENDIYGLRRGDFTIECWALWRDRQAGGRDFGTKGNVLFNFAAGINVGIGNTGTWQMTYGAGFNTTVNMQQTSTFVVSTATDNRWDHIVAQRKARNVMLYVNGVEVGQLPLSWIGTVAANGNPSYNNQSTTYDPDWYNVSDALRLGTDWNQDNISAWTGYMQDFRMSAMARYETRVIKGVPTMCHIGTSVPALPTKLHPTG